MRYFDDISVGDRMELGTHTFTAEDIKTFAAQYDPQAFHMDEAAAAKSHFGALCASGWHTIAVWMRLRVLYGRREDAERAARGEVDREARALARLPRAEMAQAGLCRRHDQLRVRGRREARLAKPARLGPGVRAQHRHQPEGRAGALLHRIGLRRAAAGSRVMEPRDRAADTAPAAEASAATSGAPWASPAARTRCTTATPT